MTGSLLAAGFVIGAVVVASRALAQRSGVPYPVFLVVAAAGVSFIPAIPQINLDPKVVFFGILPPLVYHAGSITSPRDLREHALPITLGALGLVLATTFAVAGAISAAEPGFGWTSAFILGAVVAPTDPVAAVSVFKRLGVPMSMTTVLEGESLVNDGIALALFGLGVAALSTPTDVAGGLVAFIKVAGGGTGFGLAVGWLVARLRRPVRDSSSQIVVSLLVPYAAYVPAAALGLSGVLATLAAGLVLGQRPAAQLGPSGRLRVAEFWEVLTFLLESVLFVLVGVQLRHLIDGLAGTPSVDVLAVSALAVGAVVFVRLLWWAAVPTLRWRPEGRLVDTGAVPWGERLVLGWSGLRGAISLAAALSIPTVAGGQPVLRRDLIIFATFCVITVTLVGQGTSLPWLLRRLSLAGTDAFEREHAVAERRCAEAALRRLDELISNGEVADSVSDALRILYERRLDRARSELGGERRTEADLVSMASIHRRLLATEHRVLRDLHQKGEISFAVMREVRRELDIDEARFTP